MQTTVNEVKRQRIIKQYKSFYTRYYEVQEQQSKNASAQNRVGSVVNVTTHLKELVACPQK